MFVLRSTNDDTTSNCYKCMVAEHVTGGMGKAFFARGGHRSYTGKSRCIPTCSRDTSGLTHATRILSCDEALERYPVYSKRRIYEKRQINPCSIALQKYAFTLHQQERWPRHNGYYPSQWSYRSIMCLANEMGVYVPNTAIQTIEMPDKVNAP